MATGSILKSVEIRDRNMGRLFVEALERAENMQRQTVDISLEHHVLKGDAVKDFFKEQK